MSSDGRSSHDELSYHASSPSDSAASPRLSNRRQPRHPESPHKRRRLESVVTNTKAEWLSEENFNENYRSLYNEEAIRVAGGFAPEHAPPTNSIQIGTSIWSAQEQSSLFKALGRFGTDDTLHIAHAISTKSESETRDFILSLQVAKARQGTAKLTRCDLPAAIEIGASYTAQLEDLGDALSMHQEKLDAAQEQERYGRHWLITSQLADEIEDAVNGIVRPSTVERGGRGIAGSCNHCRQRKLKCNRGDPCSNCFKSKADCMYPERPLTALEPEDVKPSGSPSEDIVSLLQSIPQADLLQPSAMLKLSRDVFMNRSPNNPSPWLHWMEYASDVSPEPSIYRTAFNDLHDLAISITRRLVKCTLMQSASRLRAARIGQGGRERLPRVKKRDVLTAVDILGLDRNGHARWIGAPRRCGLQLYTQELTTAGRRKRMIPLEEVESILRASSPIRATTSEPTSPIGAETFKSRAARSGTPLPLQDLAISDSADDYAPSQHSIEEEETSITDNGEEDHIAHRKPHQVPARDEAGRYISAPPRAVSEHLVDAPRTLEAFDQEARRQEERVLQDLLGLKSDLTLEKYEEGSEDAYNEFTEIIVTGADDWRKYTTYKSEWEDTNGPVSLPDLMANRKSPSADPSPGQDKGMPQRRPVQSSGVDSEDDRQSIEGAIELPTHDARSYAALHNTGFVHSEDESENDHDSEAEDIADIPTQSIEMDGDRIELGDSGSEMDWK